MLRLVLSYKTRGDKNPSVEYLGHDGEKARSSMESAAKPKGRAKAPEMVELFTLSRPLKRYNTEGPSKEEIALAKARDERLKQKASKKKGDKSEDLL